MRQAGVVSAGIALAVTVGCAASTMGGRDARLQPHQNPPAIVVVLQDHSPPSGKVSFRVSRAVAHHEGGQAIELRVAGTPGTGETAGDVLWLEGELPPGAYTGLEVTFGSASRLGPGPPEPLEVPSEPIRVAAPFAVSAGAGGVLAVALRSSLDPDSPARFRPILEGRLRPRPTTGLLGLVSVGGWDSVALFDKRSGGLASLLPVGRGPAGMALDAERVRAYVAVSEDDTVATLDLLEGRIREHVPLRAGDRPRDVVLTPDGRTLVVANAGSDTVSFVDPLSAIEIERIAVPGRPAALLLDRDGRRVFVLAERSGTMSVVSISSRSVVGAVAIDSGAVRARLAGRNGERIVVAHSESPYLSIVDSRTLAVEQRVYVGPGAQALEVDPRSGRIFLARARTGRIEVFDPSSFLPVDEIPVPGEVSWLFVESEGNGLGVVVLDPAEVRILGLVGGDTLVRTPLGSDPVALLFVQGRTHP